MLGGDREPEPAAAEPARGIGHGEPLEDPVEPVGGTPGPRSASRASADSTVASEADVDGRAGRMLARVVEQVAEDPLQPARVGLDDELRSSGSSSAASGRRAAATIAANEPAEIDRL